MVTTDVARIRLFWFQLKDFVFCPFMVLDSFKPKKIKCLIQIIVSVGGLFSVIGWNVFYGVGVLVLFMPTNFFIARVQSRYEVRIVV